MVSHHRPGLLPATPGDLKHLWDHGSQPCQAALTTTDNLLLRVAGGIAAPELHMGAGRGLGRAGGVWVRSSPVLLRFVLESAPNTAALPSRRICSCALEAFLALLPKKKKVT